VLYYASISGVDVYVTVERPFVFVDQWPAVRARRLLDEHLQVSQATRDDHRGVRV
jgi:hypothetical protein